MTTSPEKPNHIWVFDINRRIYGPDNPGPIWREHWKKCEVLGETSRSWILDRHGQIKVPKKRNEIQRRIFAFSESEIDDLEWVEKHKYKIAREVELSSNPAVLRTIASLVGYKP